MTRNCLAAGFVLAGILCFAFPGVCDAQAIPANIKSSTSGDQITPAVRAFVGAQAERLKSADASARGSARDLLIDEAEVGVPGVSGGGAGSQISAAYRDIYSRELNAALLKLMNDTALETRINATIVAARVAPRDISAHLEGVTRAALADKQDPVVLWGLKAAAQLLPSSLNLRPTNNALLAAVSESALAHADSILVIDAYDALTLTSYSSDARVLRDLIPEDRWRRLVPLVFPELVKLWSARLQMYADGLRLDPSAERIPALFFGSLRTWPALSQPQQQQAMQSLVDQLTLSGERAIKSDAEKDLFINTVYRPTASAIVVIGQAENSEPIQAAGRAAGAISGTTVAAAIEQATSNLVGAIKSLSKFSSLKPPPEPQARAGGPTTATTRPGG